MRAVDPRLLRHARAARGYLIVTVLLGLAVTGLILAQAALLAHGLAAAARGTGAAALAGTLVVLLGVVVARGAAAYGGEAAALRAAARVKSQLRRKLIAHCLRLGPAWLGGQQPGQIAATATRGLDGLDPYFARYLPQLGLDPGGGPQRRGLPAIGRGAAGHHHAEQRQQDPGQGRRAGAERGGRQRTGEQGRLRQDQPGHGQAEHDRDG